MNAEHLIYQSMLIHWSADTSKCQECLSSSSCTPITSLETPKLNNCPFNYNYIKFYY